MSYDTRIYELSEPIGSLGGITKMDMTDKNLNTIYNGHPFLTHPESEIKISNTEKGTKADSGKAPLHMCPEEALIGMAHAFGYGAKKYDKWNYKKGIELTRLTDSLRRHTYAYLSGEDIDPESGLPHTWLMLANTAMIEYMRVNKPEMDDRYKK